MWVRDLNETKKNLKLLCIQRILFAVRVRTKVSFQPQTFWNQLTLGSKSHAWKQLYVHLTMKITSPSKPQDPSSNETYRNLRRLKVPRNSMSIGMNEFVRGKVDNDITSDSWGSEESLEIDSNQRSVPSFPRLRFYGRSIDSEEHAADYHT